MVVWGFVLSLVGFFGVTAIIGIVLAFIGRPAAKQVGRGVGLSTAAIIIGAAWLALAAVGGIVNVISGTTESVQPTPTPAATTTTTPLTPSPAETTTDLGSLGVTITDFPSRWNSAVAEYGVGDPLPERISGTPNLPGYSSALTEFPSGNSVDVVWNTETGEVVEVTIYGLSDVEDAATAIIADAAAMAYATTDLTFSEGLDLINDLMGDTLANVVGFPEIAEELEQPDRVYRFYFFANAISFSVNATPQE
jgi:hypothetical protein